MNKSYDLLILGSGSAGFAAAQEATKAGLKVAIIGEEKELVGHCILHGCMPGKVFVEAADHYQHVRRAAEFGVTVKKIQTSPRKLAKRKKELVEYFEDSRRVELKKGSWVLYRDRARFIDAHTVELESSAERLKGSCILIATGSRVAQISLPGLQEIGAMDSDALMDSKEVPKTIVIMGGGAVALEAAHYLSAFGCSVTIIQRSAHVLTRLDPDLADFVADALAERGVNIVCDTKLLRVARVGAHKCVYFEHEAKEKSAAGEEILFALGRQPRLGCLCLERTGVRLENGRIAVNAFQQTNIPHIFAAGDVATCYPVLNHAVCEGTAAGQNAALLLCGEETKFKAMDYRLKLFALFTHPQIASVGLTETEARASGIDFDVVTYPFGEVGKAIVLSQERGIAKLIVKRGTGEILGAGLAGPLASELIHIAATAMHFHSTATDLCMARFYHPTLSEIWSSTAQKWSGEQVG
jgi:pyruvate/2-oxoglutarate dehydrogenase complex dihydrolipoamide dehydrogenase (E3) component